MELGSDASHPLRAFLVAVRQLLVVLLVGVGWSIIFEPFQLLNLKLGRSKN
jgi:hypothetical protein